MRDGRTNRRMDEQEFAKTYKLTKVWGPSLNRERDFCSQNFIVSHRLTLHESPTYNKFPLRKHAYSNILKNWTPKNGNFQIKYSDIFHISAQNIDCGYSLDSPRRGGSNEYPQSMFLSRNKKNNAYPCKPQFYYIKVGFKGVNII